MPTTPDLTTARRHLHPVAVGRHDAPDARHSAHNGSRTTPTRSDAGPPIFPAMGAWSQRAACADADGDLFFDPHPTRIAQARQICHACPVLQQCRTWAVPLTDLQGVWGATTGRERQLLRRATPNVVQWKVQQRNEQIRQMRSDGYRLSEIAQRHKVTIRTVERALAAGRAAQLA